MGTNSIRENLNKDTIISEIKLSLGADYKKKNIYLVVEGKDDVKFLRKFCKSDITIYESFSGKQGVEEIISSKVISNCRVIGIRDRDYCSNTTSNRMFFYDKCCLEMMIVSFDEIFVNLHYEFYNDTLDPSNLKTLIFGELYKVSEVRKYNEENLLGINFKGLNFSTLINKENKLELDSFINELKKLNPQKEIDFLSGIVKSKKVIEKDCLDITNGHDFLFFFKTLCDKKCNKKVPSADQISSALRTAFNKEHFSQTELYRLTSEYCKANKLNLWSF